MNTHSENNAGARTQLAILYSLLLNHVFVKSPVTLSQVLKHAGKMSDGTLKTVKKLITRLEERNPLLWFKLLMALRQGDYCLQTLLREGIVSESHMSSGNVRTELAERVIATSPYTLASWVMVEHPYDKKPVKTMLHGPEISLRVLPHVQSNQRLYAVVRKSKSDPVPFKHVTLINKE